MNIDSGIITLYFYYRKVWKLNPVSSWILATRIANMEGIKG